jgi:alkylhydroperoxidase family enzyme
LRVAHRRGNAYEWSHHQRLGRRAGLSSAEIEHIGGSTNGIVWPARERLLLAAVDELLDTRDLSDATYTELRSHLDDRRIIEFLLLVGHYDMLATTLSTLRIEPDQRRNG